MSEVTARAWGCTSESCVDGKSGVSAAELLEVVCEGCGTPGPAHAHRPLRSV